jgi:hypothetical protein
MVIWEFPLKLTLNNIKMPEGAKILTCANPMDTPTLWAMVDPTAPKEVRTFRIIPTGGADFAQEGLEYIGTVHKIMGWMVYHVFEEK